MPNDNSLKKEGFLKLPIQNSPPPSFSKPENLSTYISTWINLRWLYFLCQNLRLRRNRAISSAEVWAVYFSIQKTVLTQMARWEELLSGKLEAKTRFSRMQTYMHLLVWKEGKWEGGGKTSAFLALVWERERIPLCFPLLQITVRPLFPLSRLAINQLFQ